MLSVPTEASAFLGLVAICMTCLLVFYLYLTKKFCFNAIGGFPCCDEPLKISKDKVSKDLVDAFSYDDELDSSSDSEDELIQRLKRSTSNQNNIIRQTSFNNDKSEVKHKALKNRHKMVRKTSESQKSDNKRSNSSLKTSICSESKIESKSERIPNAIPSTSGDLISLAEKGRIGKNGSSEGSCSSEAGSADNEDESHQSHTSFSKEKTKSAIKSNKSSHSNSINFRDDMRSQFSNTAFEKCESDAQSSNSQEFSAHLHSDSQPITKCGSIEIGYAYDAPTKKLIVNVFEASDIPCKERGGANQIHVRLVLLPHKRQKHKSKVKSSGNPIFNETFTFNRINPDDVMNLGIRFRVYGISFARREHLIGESIIIFACMKPQQQETRLWLTLEPRSNLAQSDSRSEVSSLARSDSTGSTQSMQHANLPEMLLGLAYNGTTGRLSVSLIKGSQFRNITMTRAPDTYVKLSLVSSSGQEISRSKTSVRRGQPNPLFKETFVFQVALFQLPDVTLMISVYNKRSMKRKEMIGWFSLGYNSSGDEELSHWNDMRDSKGEQVCRWHVLLES